jgi:hypothetical protein
MRHFGTIPDSRVNPDPKNSLYRYLAVFGGICRYQAVLPGSRTINHQPRKPARHPAAPAPHPGARLCEPQHNRTFPESPKVVQGSFPRACGEWFWVLSHFSFVPYRTYHTHTPFRHFVKLKYSNKSKYSHNIS